MTLYKMVDGKNIKVSKEEEALIKQQWQENEVIRKEKEYIFKRIRKYPSVGDQLDAIYSIVKTLKASGIEIGVEGDEWVSKLKQVKNEYPKGLTNQSQNSNINSSVKLKG